jgi:hypothetical protein
MNPFVRGISDTTLEQSDPQQNNVPSDFTAQLFAPALPLSTKVKSPVGAPDILPELKGSEPQQEIPTSDRTAQQNVSPLEMSIKSSVVGILVVSEPPQPTTSPFSFNAQLPCCPLDKSMKSFVIGVFKTLPAFTSPQQVTVLSTFNAHA